MNNKRFRLIYCALCIAYCVLSTSCFHKDVMDDRADDLSQSFIYSNDSVSYIITQELIFQATSKSSGGGITHISGYNECRLTSYDLATGAMLGRVELGEQMETACEMIGVYDNKIWCYSIDPELGLHSRDPKTLEVISAEKEIAAVVGFDFARPEWSTISNYYAFDFEENRIILTDNSGVHWRFDPIENSIETRSEDLPRVDPFKDCLGSTAYFADDSFASFSGSDDRRKLTWNYEDSTADLSFLKPSFFIDNSEVRALQRFNEKKAMLESWKAVLIERLDSICAAHPILAGENSYMSYGKMTTEERDLQDVVYSLDRDIEDVNRELDDLEGPFYSNNDYALNNKRYGVLVYSTNSVSDTSHVVLTCLDCKSKKFTERWHLDLPSFYFDPDKAEGAGVFEDGDPEFDYWWADVHDGKFVMIAQLQMVCVDMTTGKKLWEILL